MRRRGLLILLMIAAAAVPAAAQTSTPSDPDLSMIHLGPFAITPSLLLRELGRDENVFNEHDNPKSDFTFTIVPGAEVVFKPRNMRVALQTAVEYVYYQDYEEERSTNRSAAGRADFTLSWFRPYVLASGVTTRQRLNQEIDERARHDERIYGGGFGIKVGTRLTLGGSARLTKLRFDEGSSFRGEDLARSFNGDVRVIDGSAEFMLTAFTTASLVVAREEHRFILAPERDSDSLRITPTFSFSPEAVLNGAIALGYRRFTPRTAALPAYSGFVATATVGTTLWNRHRVETIFGRDIRYSYERDTPYYLMTGVTATDTIHLAGPFDLRVTGTRQLLAYRGNELQAVDSRPGDDTFTSYGGGVGYRVREHFRLGLNMEWSHRDSELSVEREYRSRRIFASMTWGKQT